jgi:cytochrome c oxidase subunit 2
VVPGIYTSVWFEATVPGRHQVYCAEYCGATHSGMLARVIALEEEDWQAWKAGRKLGQQPDVGIVEGVKQASLDKPTLTREQLVKSLAEQGRVLTETKGCVACHTAGGESKLGPSFAGVYGGKVELADGRVVTADENYLRESIEKPQAKVVKGYGAVMPTFRGLLSETEMNAVIAYIKSIR